MQPDTSHARYRLVLLAAFAVFWLWMAIDPVNRHDWALENLLVLGVAAALLAARRHYRPSPTAATLIVVYLVLHEIGAHYTYAKVPYDAAWQALTGYSLNEAMGWQRNQYDRLVHFGYGLLLAYPFREVQMRLGLRPGLWSYLLPINLVLATSAIYELIEWMGAVALDGGLGRAFLAAQSDEWDAQKDMALAALGSLLAMGATALLQRAPAPARARAAPERSPAR